MFITADLITHKTTRSFTTREMCERKVREFIPAPTLEKLHWFIHETTDGRFAPVFFVGANAVGMFNPFAVAHHGWPVFN